MSLPTDYTDWIEFARRDDCLDQMVPSDLRGALQTALIRGRADGIKELIGDLELRGIQLTDEQLEIARKTASNEQPK